MKFIQNIECGNIFPYTLEGLIEMKKEARELYDIDDPTNDVSISEYYQIIEVWKTLQFFLKKCLTNNRPCGIL